MLIRPTDVSPPLPPLTGVSGSSRSMDRDARERSPLGAGGHTGDEAEGDEKGAKDSAPPAHIIDETA